MSLGYNTYCLFENAFEKVSKDLGNRIKMRPGERALDLLTRVQVATRRAELVPIAPGTLGDSVGKIHPAVVPSAGIGVFFGALNSFDFGVVDRVTQLALIAQHKQGEFLTWRAVSDAIIASEGLLRSPHYKEPVVSSADGNAFLSGTDPKQISGKGSKCGKGIKGDNGGKGNMSGKGKKS